MQWMQGSPHFIGTLDGGFIKTFCKASEVNMESELWLCSATSWNQNLEEGLEREICFE